MKTRKNNRNCGGSDIRSDSRCRQIPSVPALQIHSLSVAHVMRNVIGNLH